MQKNRYQIALNRIHIRVRTRVDFFVKIKVSNKHYNNRHACFVTY